MALWASAPWTWEAWPRLDEAVRSGKAVFPDIYGKEFFEYLKEVEVRRSVLLCLYVTHLALANSHA